MNVPQATIAALSSSSQDPRRRRHRARRRPAGSPCPAGGRAGWTARARALDRFLAAGRIRWPRRVRAWRGPSYDASLAAAGYPPGRGVVVAACSSVTCAAGARVAAGGVVSLPIAGVGVERGGMAAVGRLTRRRRCHCADRPAAEVSQWSGACWHVAADSARRHVITAAMMFIAPDGDSFITRRDRRIDWSPAGAGMQKGAGGRGLSCRRRQGSPPPVPACPDIDANLPRAVDRAGERIRTWPPSGSETPRQP